MIARTEEAPGQSVQKKSPEDRAFLLSCESVYLSQLQEEGSPTHAGGWKNDRP